MRSAAFSAVCVTLAVLGHVAAGGSGPEPWAVAAGTAAVTMTALSLAGRERSATTVHTTLTGAQLLLHELFALSDPSGGSPGFHPHGQGLGESLGMLLAHLTATLITGWWLARGESALWALLRAAGHRLAAAGRRAGAAFRLLAVPASLRAAPPATPPGTVPLPVRALLRHTVSRRGPPLRTC
ncbi:MFS transporter [Planomonospora sp. ID67723]|uniref:MFS transporter n=1 Tax=Planomonospora sp. ID67723 TaxID=2738134 RepID=UPI001E64B3A5|nr:MFS transporter [Planomonospora sp. ID67723]